MALEVSLMTPADIDGAIDTVQQAFAEDPYNRWIYNDRSKFSPVRNRVSLTLRYQWGIKHGLCQVCREMTNPTKILGTAMWIPPQHIANPESWAHYLSSWYLWFRQVAMNTYYGRGGLNVKRYWLWKEAQAEVQKELWTDENGYYFCNVVTVLPEAQGKGVGRALMEQVLAIADKEGRKCYLESSRKEPNVAIYEKFGFELVKEMKCDDDGDAILLFCMIREPVPQSTGLVF
ncbi:acyl-CoA N-acyltransferase [Tothia fuscella]|uniref:Acyl-CoA N-acyltransferase n=1 Tax=Tothia fuscella TaxID=1048955 RepID=A0A9P4NLB8_9PEZI|nr:acyl-CoA N-acyltransferase [Tothia fuscella]